MGGTGKEGREGKGLRPPWRRGSREQGADTKSRAMAEISDGDGGDRTPDGGDGNGYGKGDCRGENEAQKGGNFFFRFWREKNGLII